MTGLAYTLLAAVATTTAALGAAIIWIALQDRAIRRYKKGARTCDRQHGNLLGDIARLERQLCDERQAVTAAQADAAITRAHLHRLRHQPPAPVWPVNTRPAGGDITAVMDAIREEPC